MNGRRSGEWAQMATEERLVQQGQSGRPRATRSVRVDTSRRGNVGGDPLADEYPVQPAVP